MKPLFSIVMPTRNRAKTLQYAIRTALFQDFDDYEIVVCDDASTDATAEVVHSYGNSRTRYVRAPEQLGIGRIFDFGIAQSRGTYTLLLGDDDGFLRNTLATIYQVIQETHAKVIQWHRAQYNWPKYPIGNLQNCLIYTKPRFARGCVPSSTILNNAVKFLDCNETAGLVNSAIHSEVFSRLRERTARCILSYAADTSTGFAIPCVVDEIFMLGKVIGVTGVSEFSHGTLLLKKEGTEIEREFARLSQNIKDFNFKYWESLGSSVSAIVLDSMHDVARHFPDKIQMQRIDMSRAYAQSIIEFRMVTNPTVRKQLIERLYRMALQSQGYRGLLKVMLLVIRGKLVNHLSSPGMRPLSSILRTVLNKRYSSPQYFDGRKYGFDNILEASEFLYEHIGR